jgi:metal-responsive CopG/Arc/MetJ family transcriptional regulator
MTRMRRVSVRLSVEELAGLDDLATRSKSSRSAVVRVAVDRWLETQGESDDESA